MRVEQDRKPAARWKRHAAIVLTSLMMTLSEVGSSSALEPAPGTVALDGLDELAFCDQFELTVSFPVSDTDIDAAERKITQLRDEKLRSPSGLWQLLLYYDTLRKYACSWLPDGGADVLARWRVRYPKSPSPTVVAAQIAECRFDLDRRLVGINFQQAPGQASIEQRLMNGLARWNDLLIANRETARSDPHYWHSLIHLMRRQRATFDESVRVLYEATTLHPTYHQLYFDVMQFYASDITPTQVEKLARYAVEKTQATDGRGMYARIYWFAFQMMYGPAAFQLPTMDWETMKVGMEDVLAQHPDAWNTNNFALFACMRGDRKTALSLLRRVGTQPYLAAWDNLESFTACSDWASETARP